MLAPRDQRDRRRGRATPLLSNDVPDGDAMAELWRPSAQLQQFARVASRNSRRAIIACKYYRRAFGAIAFTTQREQ